MKIGLALLGGALAALAFPTFNLAFLAFVALVPLLWGLLPRDEVIRPGAAFRLGYFFGAAFFLVLLHWIPDLPPENVTVPFLMYPALGLMVAYLALFPAVWATGVVLVCRGGAGRHGGRHNHHAAGWSGALALALAAPSLWILLEWVRNLGVIGFPWGSLGYSQWSSLTLVQFASIGGFWSVSFWVVLVNVAVFGLLRGAGRARLVAAAAIVVLFAAPWLYGRSEIARWSRVTPDPAAATGRARDFRTQAVVLIQQNTGNDKWSPDRRSDVIRNLVNMTLEAAPSAPRSALFIWPETATPTLLLLDDVNYGIVQSVAAEIDRPILTGFPDRRFFQNVGGKDIEARYYNAAGLLMPGRGIVETYAKMRLVPFSEWMPVPGLNRVNFGQSNFTPGDTLRVFRGLENWGPMRAADHEAAGPPPAGPDPTPGRQGAPLSLAEAVKGEPAGGPAGTDSEASRPSFGAARPDAPRTLPDPALDARPLGERGPRFGVLVCYESIFPGMSRSLVRNGADFLINITNDQWFGKSPAPYQHLTMAIFRAIENRVGIARAANTGVSCIIAPTGAIQKATPLFEPATVQGEVRLAGAPTFYTRFGDWILLVAAAAIVLAVFLPKRRHE